MAFEFRRGNRQTTGVLLAFAGPSGSGKTYTAISFALGLAYPGMTPAQILAAIEKEGRCRIVVLDSEGGRALHYAPKAGQQPDFQNNFPFEYADLKPPFTPQSYQDAVVGADDGGFKVIVVDSASHEYESEGGILDWADRLAEGVPKPGIENPEAWKKDQWIEQPVKSPGNWKEPKRAHKKMVNRMLQCRAHLIFCLRAEEKMQLVSEKFTGNDGKEKVTVKVIAAADRPLKERWEPICEKRFMYEMTASFILLPSQPGVGVSIKLQEQHRPCFPEGQQIGGQAGAAMAAWASADVQPGEGAPPPPPPPAGGSAEPKRTLEQQVDAYVAATQSQPSLAAFREMQADARTQKFMEKIKGNDLLFDRVTAANTAAYERLSGDAG